MSAESEMLTNMMLVIARLEKKLDQVINQTAPTPPADDETVHRMPSEKYWTGDDYKTCKLSDCPPDFLRAYAKYRAACAYAARKNDSEDKKKMEYAARDEKSAKLATAWADYRMALGYSAPPVRTNEAPQGEPDLGAGNEDGSIPF